MRVDGAAANTIIAKALARSRDPHELRWRYGSARTGSKRSTSHLRAGDAASTGSSFRHRDGRAPRRGLMGSRQRRTATWLCDAGFRSLPLSHPRSAMAERLNT